ncbi:hypothetical protein MHH70_03285 [Metasolibacillus sp. FSL H7-0170]|uniref:hypothetical protein n=1 Tax=Metasolibacillus TaxID=2703677 RepID=UPI000792E67E|nr:hypothetical protein [Metasolibacillus fluoroglycofenilyticus]KYG92090.1 hypothetical protein A0U40_03880 [[Bacillus] sp. KCTC 13219]
MANNMPYRYAFFVIGICLFIFSPLIIFLIPRMIPMTFYFVKYTWVYYVPTEAYTVFAVGIAILIICCAFLFFGKMKKWAIISSSILFLTSIVIFYGSSRCYIAMDDNGFTYRGLFEQQKQYVGWENVTQIERIEVPAGKGGNATYIVSLDNGDALTFKETAHVQEYRSKMRGKYGKYNIPVIYTN